MSKEINKILKAINKKINSNFAKKITEEYISEKHVYREPPVSEPTPYRESISTIFDKDNKEDETMADPNTTNSNVGISSPWIRYIHKIQALFGKDPEIHIEWNEDKMLLNIRVDNQKKADAISELLPVMKKFGNVDILINVIPSNKIAKSAINTIKAAFEGNPVVSKYYEVPDIMLNRIYYMMFAHEIVQYFDDNLADPRGFVSTLYEDIAAEVIENHDGVYFCTDDYSSTNNGEE